MATTGTSENGTKNEFTGIKMKYELYSKDNHKTSEKVFKPAGNTYNKDNKAKQFGGNSGYNPGKFNNRSMINKQSDAGERYNKPSGLHTVNEKQVYNSEWNRNSYKYQNPKAKDDDDDEYSLPRARKISDTKVKSQRSDEIEEMDKYEIIKRLEREKKAIQKKAREDELERTKRPVMKQKRSTKDWTKDYENGLIAEDEY